MEERQMISKISFCVVLAAALIASPAVLGAGPVYKDFFGNYVEFDPVEDWGYNPDKPHDVVYYGSTDNPAFSVTYQDVVLGNGFGFDDPTQGANRRARVVDALNYIAGTLAGETGPAHLHFQESYNLPTNPTLASCGAFYWQSPFGFQGGFMYDHITTGIDPSPTNPDAVGSVNFGHNWYAGTGTPGGSQYDLQSVMLHEITHGLGYASLVEYGTGYSVISGGNPGVFSNFDYYLQNGNGAALFSTANGATFIGNPVNDLLGMNNGVRFSGPEATADYGPHPPIYAPNPWEDGSSISHWALTVPNAAVMRPFYSPGEVKRVYVNFEIGCLEDIGYDIGSTPDTPTPGPTPTPDPWADVPATGPIGIAMLIGLVSLLIGFTGRKRN